MKTMIERQLEIATRDGATSTFITHPERGGPHPVILFFMDAPGIREELRDMARRLASAGYYVMLPNLYYRAGVMELAALTGLDDTGRRTRMFELMNALDIPLVVSDTHALLAFADADPAAARGAVGAVGYCMSGRYAVNAATHFERVAAAASIYGVRLVTDEADSPHLAGSLTGAELYFACAELDQWAPLEILPPLREALAASGAVAEVELYPGVEHGFAFPGRAAYDRDAAERHWERLFALFRRRLA
jgi:carboxymethylenebutenolidase